MINETLGNYCAYARQTEWFMLNIIPMLVNTIPLEGQTLKVLDLGARSGHGSALLHRLFAPTANAKLVFQVEATNLNKEEVEWFKAQNFGIKCWQADIFNDRDYNALKSFNYDIVICSHMIEHTTNPDEVIRRVRSLAKQRFVIACPYEEANLDHGTWKHDSKITNEMLVVNGIIEHTIRNDPGYETLCFYGVYEGHSPTYEKFYINVVY